MGMMVDVRDGAAVLAAVAGSGGWGCVHDGRRCDRHGQRLYRSVSGGC